MTTHTPPQPAASLDLFTPTTAFPIVIWHGDQRWGTRSFRIGDRLYRRARLRETSKIVEIQTRYGVARLRPLNRRELRLLDGRK
jgi:phage gp46-like protein